MRWLIAHLGPYRIPLVLLGACVLAYGLFSTSLGFYWDGWPFAWISETFGNAGLVRYFSTNRPVWGWLYQITTPLIGAHPATWQIFGLVMRWGSGVALWLLLRKLWPGQHEAAAWAALLFVLYPGFSQSSIANMYGHFYIVLAIALLSLWLHLKMVPSPDRFRTKNSDTKKRIVKPGIGTLNLLSRNNLGVTIISLALATYCIFATEYFFGLELFRPLLLFIALPPFSFRQRIKSVFSLWWPFGLLILIYAYWRIFVLGFQTYDPVAFVTAAPASQTILQLIARIVGDILRGGLAAWAVPITKLVQLDWASRFPWIALVLIFAAAIQFFILLRQKAETPPGFSRALTTLGLSALILGGLPVWAIGLPIRFSFPNDRLTLPMMAGASILVVGLCYLLVRSTILRRGFFAVLAGLALAFQFLTGADYRQDWKYQQSFFWQLAWRAPHIQSETILILNELEWLHITDNSLVAPINWLYAPGNDNDQLEYYVAFVPLRTRPGSLLDPLAPGHKIHSDYLVANFEGSTDRALVLLFDPPSCLRVLDPIYDQGYPQLPDGLREAVPLSKPIDLISSSGTIEPARIFGAEPSHDSWCYYFQKADLARQQRDWDTVAELGDAAFALDESPNHATERLPFIEGYAMTGRWREAESLAHEMLEINRFTRPMLCSLWERVNANAESPDISTIQSMLALTCP
ncbi:MAG: hypothetical protein ACRDFQ_05250 [Anaerolineales bacterium]